jgi:hypothetical protein
MAQITTNTSRLSVLLKCAKGQVIINLRTDNPEVPGNGEILAEFSAVQAELYAAEVAVALARNRLAEMVVVRDGIEKRWDGKIASLAGFTQAATGGNPVAILTTGFGVRGVNAKPQPLPAPIHVAALTNGFPGRTKLTWEGVDGTVIYLIEISLDTATPVNWKNMEPTTKSSCEVDDAEPGKHAWFRVAAVNAAGQSPWSAPARRPVM